MHFTVTEVIRYAQTYAIAQAQKKEAGEVAESIANFKGIPVRKSDHHFIQMQLNGADLNDLKGNVPRIHRDPFYSTLTGFSYKNISVSVADLFDQNMIDIVKLKRNEIEGFWGCDPSLHESRELICYKILVQEIFNIKREEELASKSTHAHKPQIVVSSETDEYIEMASVAPAQSSDHVSSETDGYIRMIGSKLSLDQKDSSDSEASCSNIVSRHSPRKKPILPPPPDWHDQGRRKAYSESDIKERETHELTTVMVQGYLQEVYKNSTDSVFEEAKTLPFPPVPAVEVEKPKKSSLKRFLSFKNTSQRK